MISSEQTRQKILKGAGEMFLQKGYEGTSIRNICACAGVNLSSVNYHFGSKRKLYLRVLEEWFIKRVEEYPLDMGVHSNSSAHHRLKNYITNWFKRIAIIHEQTDDYSIQRTRLLLLELSTSTPKPGFIDRCFSRDYVLLSKVIHEISSEANADSAKVKRKVKAVIGICLFHLVSLVNPDIGELVGCEMDIETTTKDIISFCSASGASL